MPTPRAYSVKAFSAAGAKTPLAPAVISRREPTGNDVKIQILYCGVCHSDLHFVRNEWGFTQYPAVPGHEIVGRVTAVGADAKKYKVGDLVGVGCLVDSCRTCPDCRAGLEQFCTDMAMTYGSADKILGGGTLGGYAEGIVVREEFVLRIPTNLNAAAVAPLLCAGITTYSPLRHWKIGAGHKVGIVGLGGLGHMGLKFARAFGAQVVLFTTSPGKTADALRLGAHEVVVSKDKDEMKAHRNSFDFILNTVAAPHNLDAFLALLKLDGTMTLVGAPSTPHPSPSVFGLIMKRRRLAGSLIGGIAETQEMLDFCAAHAIVADIEPIAISQIETAYDRMLKNDVKYRFVIDMATLEEPAAA